MECDAKDAFHLWTSSIFYSLIMKMKFQPKIFLHPISICAVIAALVSYFFQINFLITFLITVGSVYINGLLATWEDRLPGGFENPHENDKGKPPEQ